MMSIVIVTSSYPSRGEDGQSSAGLFVRDFARCVAEQGVRVRVVTQDKGSAPLEDPHVEVITHRWSGADLPAVELRLKSPKDLPRIWSFVSGGIAAVRDICRHDPPSRCLCMWAVPSGYMAMQALKGTGIPYDVWCLGSDVWIYGRSPVTRWLVRKVLQRAQALFADGRLLAAEAERLAARPCRFLPSSRFLPETTTRPALKNGKPNLLFIGRWHANKGVDLLPETMSLLRREGVDAHLHIFGGGRLQDELVRLVRCHGVTDCVTIHGYADDETAAAYLRGCDLLLIPSRVESIPVAFSDAVKCGIPLVATDVGDMGMLLSRYRVGELSPPESAPGLAQAIRRALQIGRDAYRRGMTQAVVDFDLRAAAIEYLKGA